MTTKNTIQGYFDGLKSKSGWHTFLADEMVFNSYAIPPKHVEGKAAYLVATKRFFSMISSVTIKDVIVDGDRACALTEYELQPPGGPAFHSHVAEIFKVRETEIVSLDIYFDSTPFPKPPAGA